MKQGGIKHNFVLTIEQTTWLNNQKLLLGVTMAEVVRRTIDRRIAESASGSTRAPSATETGLKSVVTPPDDARMSVRPKLSRSARFAPTLPNVGLRDRGL